MAKQRSELMAAQERYGREIVAWLAGSFPDLCSPAPHPAAMAAVIRLHWTVGKGKLTRAEHGAEIRAAVARFDERFPEVPAA